MYKVGSFSLTFLIFFLLISHSYAEVKQITFAISPMASPVSNLSTYYAFIRYLSEKTGYRVVMKQRRTCDEINSLLETGEAQFALTCSGAFLNGRHDSGLTALAVPVIEKKTSHHSFIIVHKKSRIEEFLKLQGKVFAFTDPLSLTGRLYPINLLKSLGVKPEEFFRKAFYTSSHEKSIISVAKGFANGAAVDSIIFGRMKEREHPSIDRVKVIKISPPYGIPPIVASPLTEKSSRLLILNALMNMAVDSAGMDILKGLQIEKFVLPDTSLYHTSAVRGEAAVLP